MPSADAFRKAKIDRKKNNTKKISRRKLDDTKIVAMKYSRHIFVIKHKNVLMYSFQLKWTKLSKDEEKKRKGSNRREK
jgi:hypothetical protein